MRKNQTQRIGEIISSILKKNGIENRLSEVRIKRAWEELLGKPVARYTKSIFFKNNILYVTISSSIARNEIMLIRDELIIKLNENIGEDIIHKIIFK
jgi:predicted nucleic acid-binding Zn ribbon protein